MNSLESIVEEVVDVLDHTDMTIILRRSDIAKLCGFIVLTNLVTYTAFAVVKVALERAIKSNSNSDFSKAVISGIEKKARDLES